VLRPRPGAAAPTKPRRRRQPNEAVVPPEDAGNPTLVAVWERYARTPGRRNWWLLLKQEMDRQDKEARAARRAAKKAAAADGGAGAA